jgi:HD-GYP domain-containing protein (c-di-GMP phosphodiesterase class II)
MKPRFVNWALPGMLHDVGKMSVPDVILNKPGKLDNAEFAVIRSHPQKGHAILAASKQVSQTALDVCLLHHEKMDGSGYPHRLAADDLSLPVRMAAICDVYDAITSQRSYNRPFSGGSPGKNAQLAGPCRPVAAAQLYRKLGHPYHR